MGAVLRNPAGEVRWFSDADIPHALSDQWTPATTEQAAIATTAPDVSGASGLSGGFEAAVTSGLSGATLGASDALIGAVAPRGMVESVRQAREVHPIVSGAAGLAGAIAPAILTGGDSLLATPTRLVSDAGRAITGAAEGAGLGRLASSAIGGAAEGALYGAGQGVSELALSQDPLTVEHVGSVLSSNMLFGGAIGGAAGGLARAAEVGLGRAKQAVDAVAERHAAISALPGDLTGLDAAGLRAARSAEVDQLATDQAAQRTAARSKVVDDMLSYRATVKDADPWLAINEGEDAARLNKATRALRSALDDVKGLRENPTSLAKPLRIEEQALDGAIANREAIAAKLDAVNAKIAKDIDEQLGARALGEPPVAPPAAPSSTAKPFTEAEYDAYKKSYSHAASTHYPSEIRYSKGGDEIVNPALRSGKPLEGEAVSLRDGLDAAFREPESRIPRAIILYRGVSDDPINGITGVRERFAHVKPGDVLEDPAYTSTAFSDAAKSRNEHVVFTIHAPSGTPALPIRTHYTFEGEMLLPRNTKFRVDRIESVPVADRWKFHADDKVEVLANKVTRVHMRGGEIGNYPPIKDIHVTVIDAPAGPVGAARAGKVTLDAPIDKLSLRQLGEYQEELNSAFDKAKSGSQEYKALSDKWDEAAARRNAISDKRIPNPEDWSPMKAPQSAPGTTTPINIREMGLEFDPKSRSYFKGSGTPEPAGPPIELSGKAARRYASYADVKLPKGGTVTIDRKVAGEFRDALINGEVRGEAQRSLDQLPGLLERNRALQTQIREATAPLAPKAELVSARTKAIDAARDALMAPAPEKSLGEKLLGGTVFGAAAGLAAGVPVVGHLLAPLAAAKASDVVTHAVFGRLAKAGGEQAQKAAQAASAMLEGAKTAAGKIAPYAPVVATKALSAVRYAVGQERDEKAATLPELFKRRTDEIKSQITVTPDGQYQMRPDARAKMAAQLDGIRPRDPILADRLETQAARRIEWLAGQIPRKPDVLATAVGGAPDWHPSDMEMRAFARKVDAAEHPGNVLDRLAHGAITPEDAAAFHAVNPEWARDITQQIIGMAPEARKSMPYAKRLALSIFAGTPTDPSMHPQVLAKLQGQFPAEPGSGGGTAAPRATPQFGSIKTISKDAATPAQERMR